MEEPSEAHAASLMLRGVAPASWNSITACRSWTRRWRRRSGCRTATSAARQLPDKAVSVLDTACARVAFGRSATPALIDDACASASWRARRPNARRCAARPPPAPRSRPNACANWTRTRWPPPASSWPTPRRAWPRKASWCGRSTPAARRAGRRGPGTRARNHRQAPRRQGRRADARPGATGRPSAATARPAGRSAAGAGLCGCAGDRRDRLGLDRHPGGPHGQRRDPHRAGPAAAAGRSA